MYTYIYIYIFMYICVYIHIYNIYIYIYIYICHRGTQWTPGPGWAQRFGVARAWAGGVQGEEPGGVLPLSHRNCTGLLGGYL